MQELEKIENLGQHLKNIREEKKIPVAQVAQELKTSMDIIQAIEANEYDVLPAPIYVKGYLRSYANYLGLDSDAIVDLYKKRYPAEPKQELILEGEKFPGINFNWQKLLRPKILIPICAVPLAIIILIVLLLARPGKNEPVTPQIPIKPTPIKETIPVPQEQEPPAKIIQPSALATPLKTPISLTAKTTAAVWLRVQADEKLIFEGILTQGEEKNWTAVTEFKLRIGSPGSLNLSVNEQELGRISPYGGPVNAIINKDGIAVEK